MKSIFFPIVSILFCLSCKKETPIVTPDPCENAYDLRSKPYTYIYKGKLPDCLVSLHFYYPENFSYSSFSINPKNEYEFCFLRNENKTNQTHLYKYNFCTHSLTLISKDVKYYADWSVKDWIVFYKEKKVWKVKSNGDSLTKLNDPFFTYASWSPSGSKYINGSKIFDEEGTAIGEIPFAPYQYVWETDTTFLCLRQGQMNNNTEILRHNLNSKKNQTIYTFNGVNNIININDYGLKSYTLYVFVNESSQNKYLKINTQTGQSTVIGTYEKSYTPVYKEISKNRLLVNLSLKDTIANEPCAIKQRNHITLMNLDGTNERQVLLPE